MSVELIEEQGGHRRILKRAALLYTPAAILAIGVTSISVWSLIQGSYAAIFAGFIVGSVAFALSVQATTAIRDLRSEPTFTRGEVRRSWSKGNVLIFFRSHYLRVERSFFVVSPVVSMSLQPGDIVEVHHWPHTSNVIRVCLLRGEDADTPPGAAAVAPLLRSGRTPYQVLGVERSAAAIDIAGAYSRRSSELVGSGADTADSTDQRRLDELREAYSILSDYTKRSAYDRSHPPDRVR